MTITEHGMFGDRIVEIFLYNVISGSLQLRLNESVEESYQDIEEVLEETESLEKDENHH